MRLVSSGFRAAPNSEVTEAERKRVVKAFEMSGKSTHSHNASLLWVIVNYCEESHIPYELKSVPGMGYHLKRSEV